MARRRALAHQHVSGTYLGEFGRFNAIGMAIWNGLVGIVVIIRACSIRRVMRASSGHIWKASQREKIKIPHSEYMDQIRYFLLRHALHRCSVMTGSDTSEVSAERGQDEE